MSEIEPVTERDIDEVLNARAAGYDIRYALEQDRRRVAERQARSYKREKDCATADDWRHRSRHLEAEWGRCSQQCAVMQGERDAARAEVAQLTAAQATMIDATGAVEGRVQKLPVPASGWSGGTSLEYVTIPRDLAGSRVLIVRKP